jgi:hypothetical protein
MLTTYYKTADPEQLSAAEYYQLYIRAEKVNGVIRYFLDENHGWFDAEGKRAIDPRTIFSDGFPTWEEAEEAQKVQLRYLAAGGFIHGFSRDPFAPNGSYHREIDPQNI